MNITSIFTILIISLLLFQSSILSDQAPYYTFTHDANTAPPVAYYDYIIVGGGTSGCALAATVSQGAKVLLLERGDMPYGNPTINNIATFAETLSNTSPTSPSQAFISTDGVLNSRARVLGGGTCLNAGFYSRASSIYVEKVGWDPKLVKESFEWVEKKVVFQPPVLQWQSAVRDGLLEAGVHPYNGFSFDHIMGTKVGGTIFDQEGRRHTAADLLEYAHPANLTVHLNAVVHQITFHPETAAAMRPAADGVLYKDSKGNMHKALLNEGPMNEVILSAGALGSPQLLMLSGIGPRNHLMAHGLNVILDSPMVGQGMTDNPMNAVVVPSPRPVEVSLVQVVGITSFGSYIESTSGLQFGVRLPTFREYVSLLNQANKSLFQTNLGNTVLPEDFTPYFNPVLRFGIILEKIIGPASSGYLELESTDPNENPRVTFNYFKETHDLERCVHGVRTIIQILESNALSSFRYPLLSVRTLMDMMLILPVNLRPRRLRTTYSLEQYCRDTVMTIWHYHGGCQVGKVVDRDYKVLGVDNLRVIDGSSFIDSPGTNPQATVMMLGR
ncbi:protein HOTHEAD-like [Impatiens glandulifera]|uniref:protein HOTHEAD-like n=1 Tax=Impatiens glandulifera TaxID=253017 RepID=UPI001FB128B9|nr:protein HOTHEAD-like [Impatiens glandulifera]